MEGRRVSAHDPMLEVAVEIRRRSAAVGVAAWSLDDAGNILADPHGDGHTGPWVRSGPLESVVRNLARRCVESGAETFAAETIAPGAALLPCVFKHDSGDTLATIGLAMDPDHFDARAFAVLLGGEACPRLDQLEPFMKHPVAELSYLGQVLQWWHADLCGANDRRIVEEGLLNEVDISFERISTFCRIARSMNNLTSPREFVEGACSQLANLLEFRWSAVIYVESSYSIPELEGLIHYGELPCAPHEFARLVRSALGTASTDRCTEVLEDDHVSSAMGSSVLIESITHDGELIGALVAGGRPERQIDTTDIIMVDTVGDLMGTFHQNAMRFGVQRELFMGTVRAMSSAIDAKDAYTRGHSDRVASLAVELAKTVGMPEEQREMLYISGLLHDVGKIGISEAVLGKAGKLTESEYDHMKQHPGIGYEILKGIPKMTKSPAGRAASPRTLGRQWLSPRSRRGRDPALRTVAGDRRRVRRDEQRPCLPRGHAAREGPPDRARWGRLAVGPGTGRPVPPAGPRCV